MFQFTRLASIGLCIQPRMTGPRPAGFPHSGITGSQPACGSPMLFAAYRALHRLSVPRHPPCALVRLTGFCFSAPTPVRLPRRHGRYSSFTDLFSSVLVSPFPLTQIVKRQFQIAGCALMGTPERSALEDFRASEEALLVAPERR
jgi:hypothetical protein